VRGIEICRVQELTPSTRFHPRPLSFDDVCNHIPALRQTLLHEKHPESRPAADPRQCMLFRLAKPVPARFGTESLLRMFSTPFPAP
jgi:hypothetical protein